MTTITISPDSHVDHHLPAETLRYVIATVETERATNLGHGLVIHTVTLPEAIAPVPCALVGPATGHKPVTEDRVRHEARPPREYTSRLITHPLVFTREVTVIVGENAGDPAVLYTAFGGPLAPREPGDPTLPEDSCAESEAFWKDHALADGTV